MSLNDKEILGQTAKGGNIYPGIANPTVSSGTTDPVTSNFIQDPTTPTLGAGAGPNFQGHKQAQRTLNSTAGVIEHHPGIIESTNIDPLNENSNKDDGWANATSRTTEIPPKKGLMSSAAQVAQGSVEMAYGFATGDQETQRAGSKNVFGK